MIKALLLDLDGTVLDKEYNYNEKLLTKLKNLISKGIEVIFVTGKDYDSLLRHVPLITDAVIENGSTVYEKQTNNLVKNKEWANLMKKNMGFLLRLFKDLEAFNPIWKGNSFTIKSQDIEKDIKIIKNHELSLKVNISINKSWIDVMAKPGTKLNGTKFLLDKKGINLNEAIFIGDEIVDIELLRNVGFPCTTANAHPYVKSLVRDVGGKISGKKYSAGVLELIKNLQ